MKICMLVIGSRGDVQPFVAFAQGLQQHGHTVRLATHECFRTFVTDQGVGFYPLAGDPKELMAFMVEHPDMITTNVEEIKKHRATLKAIFASCWKACTAVEGSETEEYHPDVLVSNPPVQVHVHIAEKLQIPVQIYFTMPWTPTRDFPHPLHTIGTEVYGNKASYRVVDELIWMGSAALINDFRKTTLGLSTTSILKGGTATKRLQVPHVYCMSPGLVQKPKDWPDHTKIVGFWFLDLLQDYTPPPDLAKFLANTDDIDEWKKPTIYIGFGSITVDDPDQLARNVFAAVEKAGVRAVVGRGWADLGDASSDDNSLKPPKSVHIIGNCPHDWLFPQLDAVVHHGGAGTTACGLRHGKPTVIVPFFGDQFFWGDIVHRRKAGPAPIPAKDLTADSLAAAIRFALEPTTMQNAQEVGQAINNEDGVGEAVKLFHEWLPLNKDGSWTVSTVEFERWIPTKGWQKVKWGSVGRRVACPKDGFKLPCGWYWCSDWKFAITRGTDQAGWQYASRISAPVWGQRMKKMSFVRRRVWWRTRRPSTPSDTAEDDNEDTHETQGLTDEDTWQSEKEEVDWERRRSNASWIAELAPGSEVMMVPFNQ
eukprot:TRINITY_DN67589_c1_g1_i1.p1 TRINITY_DN67589_c1_g1~~TRINITY_DN67589_c1_g1_i1.p1  ORF type:complete len:688 (-),score=58.50 TRINITY_DN67589_c1_g1_i1:131-1915(-)